MKLRSLRRPAVLTAASVAVLAVAFSGTAVADALLTGDDIKNGTLTGKDIDNGSIKGKDIKDNSLEKGDLGSDSVGSSELRDGAVGLDHLSAKAIAGLKGEKPVAGPDTGLVETNWGVVLRNTLGAADAELRTGPSANNFGAKVEPPHGSGSLQIDTVADTKVDFGNEVDFAGQDLTDLLDGKAGFSVYTTKENESRAAKNLPVIRIEVDPNLSNHDTGFSTLVFVPDAEPVKGAWKEYNQDDGKWYLTGAAGTASGCSLSTMCNFAGVMAKLGDAKVFTVSVGKGRDSEFHGAVDGLRLGNTVYDFEARGVFATKA